MAVAVFGLGLIGYVVNAILERKAQAARMRTDAYLDFCKAQNTMAVIRDSEDPEFKRMDALCLDAKNRILIYGSSGVVSALRELCSDADSYTTPQGLKRFTDLLSAMRKDAVGKLLTEEEVARTIVFKRGEDIRSALPGKF